MPQISLNVTPEYFESLLAIATATPEVELAWMSPEAAGLTIEASKWALTQIRPARLSEEVTVGSTKFLVEAISESAERGTIAVLFSESGKTSKVLAGEDLETAVFTDTGQDVLWVLPATLRRVMPGFVDSIVDARAAEAEPVPEPDTPPE